MSLTVHIPDLLVTVVFYTFTVVLLLVLFVAGCAYVLNSLVRLAKHKGVFMAMRAWMTFKANQVKAEDWTEGMFREMAQGLRVENPRYFRRIADIFKETDDEVKRREEQ